MVSARCSVAGCDGRFARCGVARWLVFGLFLGGWVGGLEEASSAMALFGGLCILGFGEGSVVGWRTRIGGGGGVVVVRRRSGVGGGIRP